MTPQLEDALTDEILSPKEALKAFVRLAARLPDPIRYEGKSSSVPYISPAFLGAAPSTTHLSKEAMLDLLLNQAESAPYGEGNRTVLNTESRKTHQIEIPKGDGTNSALLPRWDGLSEALEEISEALTPVIKLEAELHKILVSSR